MAIRSGVITPRYEGAFEEGVRREPPCTEPQCDEASQRSVRSKNSSAEDAATDAKRSVRPVGETEDAAVERGILPAPQPLPGLRVSPMKNANGAFFPQLSPLPELTSDLAVRHNSA